MIRFPSRQIDRTTGRAGPEIQLSHMQFLFLKHARAPEELLSVHHGASWESPG